MATVFEKLNLGKHQEIVVLHAPASFEAELSALPILHLHRHLPASGPVNFLLAFVTRQSEVDELAARILTLAAGDAIVWFAYPKASSKQYACDFNRDTGWAALEAGGFETVRAVAIDADWTALRFRRSEFVKARRKLPA
jgi:hypothetical protein